jgi:prepilin-type N-terminal cleavage/methylation domain-containing protein
MRKKALLRRTQGGAPGMALLEVIVAIAILAVAALSTVAWVSQAAGTVVRADEATAEVDSASDYLDRVALWTRADLDRHLGPRRQGNWTVIVERPTSELYMVTMRDSTDSRTILRTTLYRPEIRHVVE